MTEMVECVDRGTLSKCAEPISMNLRADHTFVEDEGWHLASKRYEEFLSRHQNKKVVYLEALSMQTLERY